MTELTRLRWVNLVEWKLQLVGTHYALFAAG